MSSAATALITGANKGLGFQTASELVHLGWTVWLGSRDDARGAAAAAALADEPGEVRPLQLDVTSDQSVDAAVAKVEAAGTGLDVLVNNAGIATGDRDPREAVHPSDFQACFGVNLFGPVRVTRAFLPLLRRSDHPRIVMVSSGLGSMALTADPGRLEGQIISLVYTSSKAALNMVTAQYAKAIPDVTINAVDPGYTATDLNGHAGEKSVEDGARIIVRMATAEPGGPSGRFFDDQGALPW